MGSGGDGTVQFNLRGLLAKETLVLVDGKRVAFGSLNGVGFSGGVDINLIPFPMIDHIDILKDGASAVYGSDAITGVVNFFLVHKFRGLEIGGSYGNTNLGASNDMGEWEAWIKAGTGDDKTEIVVIADFWQRTGGVFSADRDISANAFYMPWGGFDNRSFNEPGIAFPPQRLVPKMFFGPGGLPEFGVNTPLPIQHQMRRVRRFTRVPIFLFLRSSQEFLRARQVSSIPMRTRVRRLIGPHASVHQPQVGTDYKGGGNYWVYNFAGVTPALAPADRQAFYGSFTRDVCDKYLTLFGDFKFVRSFFDASAAAVPFAPDPFKIPGTNIGFSQGGISVPIQNPFNPFTIADATIPNFFPDGSGLSVTTGVRFRGINDTGPRHEKFTYWDSLFDVGLRGEMGEFGDYFKTWNWELGFRYSRNEGQDLSVNEASQPGLRQALLDTNPATAFDPFLNFNARNTSAAAEQVYVTLHNTLTQGLFGQRSTPETPRSGPRPWRARKVREWTTLDLITSYTFNLPAAAAAQVPGFAKDGGKNVKTKDGEEKAVVPLSTAEYGCSNWKWWLNNTTITLGMQNALDSNPPFVAGSFENGYDESLATIKGRFWYAQLKKKF